MKESDLRKGNILYFPFIGKNVEVVGVVLKDDKSEPYNLIQVSDGKNYYMEPLSVFKPIPLSEGVIKDLDWYWNESNNSLERLHQTNCSLKKTMLGSYVMVNLIRHHTIVERINYVHELQNAYYVVAREELVTDKVKENDNEGYIARVWESNVKGKVNESLRNMEIFNPSLKLIKTIFTESRIFVNNRENNGSNTTHTEKMEAIFKRTK